MKLRKDKWENAFLGDVAEITSSKRIFYSEYVDEGVPFFRSKEIIDRFNKREIQSELYIQEKKFNEIKSKFGAPEKDDILLTAVGTIGIPYLVKATDCFYFKDGNLVWFKKPKISLIVPEFLFMLMQSSYGQDKFKAISSGTAQSALTIKALKQIEIPLPPLEEQKQIAALFQSIETAIEQVEKQEKNVKALWKKLIDGSASDNPIFGNLLKGKKLKKVNYCDVTEKIMRKIDPVSCGVERIVAGENLESEDFKIRTWGTVGKDCLGPAFHVLFKTGDILYGSRRTYLRKVALADFEGVCANTTYVIRAKEEFLLQDLLKHIMLSERFTQYSIGVSKGSTNPYINWKDLDNFSFQIPDIETQNEIVKVLDDLINIIEQLKQQIIILKNLKQKLLSEILG